MLPGDRGTLDEEGPMTPPDMSRSLEAGPKPAGTVG
jgi:hypothetical protein